MASFHLEGQLFNPEYVFLMLDTQPKHSFTRKVGSALPAGVLCALLDDYMTFQRLIPSTHPI
jgi:hypothetical protein